MFISKALKVRYIGKCCGTPLVSAVRNVQDWQLHLGSVPGLNIPSMNSIFSAIDVRKAPKFLGGAAFEVRSVHWVADKDYVG